MNPNYIKVVSVDVTGLRVFEDASGAPAVVRVANYAYAFDTLGSVRCSLLQPVSGSRLESKIAAGRAKAAYVAARDAVVSAAWLKANADLYAVAQETESL
jgi:hypothetical protein